MMEDPEEEETVMTGLAYEIGNYRLLIGFSAQIFAFGFILPDRAIFLHIGPFNVGVCW